MSKKGVRIRILVEDDALERLVRYVLLELGYDRGDLYFLVAPPGRGSAKHWIELKYPQEVQTQRKNVHFQRVALLAGTDADQLSVAQRREALDKTLQTPRKPDEQMAHPVLPYFLHV